ncbi:hypothetical protein [Methylobacterium radiotolerans]|uniref:hypothetical protein n=1 Tax=Methylobacterium radiotolerans TaxID=31998 RepID=UPI00339B1E38
MGNSSRPAGAADAAVQREGEERLDPAGPAHDEVVVHQDDEVGLGRAPERVHLGRVVEPLARRPGRQQAGHGEAVGAAAIDRVVGDVVADQHPDPVGRVGAASEAVEQVDHVGLGALHDAALIVLRAALVGRHDQGHGRPRVEAPADLQRVRGQPGGGAQRHAGRLEPPVEGVGAPRTGRLRALQRRGDQGLRDPVNADPRGDRAEQEPEPGGAAVAQAEVGAQPGQGRDADEERVADVVVGHEQGRVEGRLAVDAADLAGAVHHGVVAVEDADIGPLRQRARQVRGEVGAQLGGRGRDEDRPAGGELAGRDLGEPALVEGAELRVEGQRQDRVRPRERAPRARRGRDRLLLQHGSRLRNVRIVRRPGGGSGSPP